MTDYRVTFGSQYGGEQYGADPHPVGGFDHVHHDGWWSYIIDHWWPRIAKARARALASSGATMVPGEWAAQGSDAHFPRGELLRLVHPDMAHHAVHLLTGSLPPDLAEHASDAPFLDGELARLLITVWGNGTGEVAYRPSDEPRVSWGPPATLTPAP